MAEVVINVQQGFIRGGGHFLQSSEIPQKFLVRSLAASRI